MVAKVWQIIGAIALGVSLMLQQGCVPLVAAGAGAAAAAGTVAYVEGELDTTYAASLDRAFNATVKALRDSQLTIVEQQKDVSHAVIKAQRSNNTPVTVKLDQTGPNATTVKIRVGTFGDEEASRALNRRIAALLGTSAG